MSPDSVATKRFVEILCKEWWDNEQEALGSEDVYRQLVNEGIGTEPHELNELLTGLLDREMVKGIGRTDRASIEQHGALVITYVDPELCKDTR